MSGDGELEGKLWWNMVIFFEIMMNSRNWKGTFADFAGTPPGFFLWISPRFPLLANQVDPNSGIVSNSLQLYWNGKLELWNWVYECLPPLFSLNNV